MKITLIMVTSLDGKTTKWDESTTHGWASPEDHAQFHTQIASTTLLIMGSKTYESIKHEITLSSHIRRIVMTSRPDAYTKEVVPGQLEFTQESPEALVRRMEGLGYTELLLVGGSQINAAFFNAKLVTHCLLTIEPKIFGLGNNLVSESKLDISLSLHEVTKLNSQGTLLLSYTVIYDR